MICRASGRETQSICSERNRGNRLDWPYRRICKKCTLSESLLLWIRFQKRSFLKDPIVPLISGRLSLSYTCCRTMPKDNCHLECLAFGIRSGLPGG
jgi:hypothetical protein